MNYKSIMSYLKIYKILFNNENSYSGLNLVNLRYIFDPYEIVLIKTETFKYHEGGFYMIESDRYSKFDKSNIKREDLVSFKEIEEIINKIKTNDRQSQDGKAIQYKVETHLKDWKNYLKDEYRPDNQPEKNV